MLETHQLMVEDRLFNLSLTIPSGTLFGIIGPNGAGKSTLLKAIAGLIPLDYGSIHYNQQSLDLLNRKERSRMIHLVPQTLSIPFDYTAFEIVEMACYSSESNSSDALARVNALHLAGRSITELSVGERQRIYLARALVTNCPILLFDEPTANLDIRQQNDIWELLTSLANEQRTVIVTNHDLKMTTRYCSGLAIINQGQCIASGPTEEVMTTEAMEEIFGVKYDPLNLIG